MNHNVVSNTSSSNQSIYTVDQLAIEKVITENIVDLNYVQIEKVIYDYFLDLNYVQIEKCVPAVKRRYSTENFYYVGGTGWESNS